MVHRIDNGGGQPQDLEVIEDVCNNIDGKSLCALGEAATWPIRSSGTQFAAEYRAHVEAGGCPFKGAEVAGVG